jgi:hypothetical protein
MEVGVAHGEVIENEPVAEGVDVGREDAEPEAGEGPGEPVEDPGSDALAGADGHGERRCRRLPADPHEAIPFGERREVDELLEDLLRRLRLQERRGERGDELSNRRECPDHARRPRCAELFSEPRTLAEILCPASFRA